MPRFRRRSMCPECKLGRTLNGFPCFCPASYSRAFKRTAGPPPSTSHIIQQIIAASPQFYPAHASVIITPMAGRIGFTGHPLVVQPNLLMTTLAG